jgi:hypothetical protein
MTTIARCFDNGVRNDTTPTKRWAPLSPPDKFDIADAKWTPAYVLASRGARGGGAGREKWRNKNAQTHLAVGVTGFF